MSCCPWLCKFIQDDWDDAEEFDEPEDEPRWAAEAFAKDAYDNKDMWEGDNEWDTEYHAVMVKSPITGKVYTYKITMEFNPSPYAEQIKKEEDK